MATTIAHLVARLSADTSAFKRDMRGAETGMQKTAKGIHRSALIAGGAIAVPPSVTIDVDAPRVRPAIFIER